MTLRRMPQMREPWSALAGVESGLERAMGIESTARELRTRSNHGVASVDEHCVRLLCEKRCHTSQCQRTAASATLAAAGGEAKIFIRESSALRRLARLDLGGIESIVGIRLLGYGVTRCKSFAILGRARAHFRSIS
jgi:hypothetical protein